MREENGYIIYTKTELKKIIKQHNDWLIDKKDKHGNSVGVRANLGNANLENANLRYANLRYANLRYANLRYANLENANLDNANLENANLENANLENANLYNADLRYAKEVPFIRMACSDTGSFIAWKKLKDGLIAKLLIPETAKRSSATTSKCRASEAIVLGIESSHGDPLQIGYSRYDRNFKYEVGSHLVVDNFDENRFNECSTGIHFFINKQEAIDY